jgi:hypothetical protein
VSQLQPTVTPPEVVPLSVAAGERERRSRMPGWLALLLANRKSRLGIVLVGYSRTASRGSASCLSASSSSSL